MDIWVAVAYLLAGFVGLLIGGDALVKAAVSLAVRTKISPAIISLTIVAAGTSAPELITSIIAALKNQPDIAVGNVAGSNIFNILAILGLSFLIKPSKAVNQKMGFEWITLLLFTLMTFWMILDFRLAKWEGGVLLAAFVFSIVTSIYIAKKRGFENVDDDEIEKLKYLIYDFLYLAAGLIFLMGGAHLALTGGVALGKIAGLSEKVIGITIVSVGTGLPELATSAVAAFRGRSDIAIGNVIGSNIMNTLAVLGGTAAILPLSINAQIVQIDIWVVIIAILLTLPVIKGFSLFVGRLFGGALLGGYIFYIWGSLTAWAVLN